MSGGGAVAPADAGPARVVRLRRRGEFVAAARGAKHGVEAFSLQMGRRRGREGAGDDVAGEVGIGITVTRKIGNAVVRNRARRRLREALRQVLPGPAKPGHDYVVVARPAALKTPFAELTRSLHGALAGVERRFAKAQAKAAGRP